MNVTSPCKDCPDRVPSCHSKCEKYITFRRELDEKNAAIREYKRKIGLTSAKRENHRWKK